MQGLREQEEASCREELAAAQPAAWLPRPPFSRPVCLTIKKEKSTFQRIMWGTAREKRLEFIRSIFFEM